MEDKNINLFHNANEIKKINYTTMYELKNKFVNNFNEIFKYNNNEIKIVGDINNPYFRAKDILKILEYSNDRNTRKTIISKIDNDFKKSLKEIMVEINKSWAIEYNPTKNNNKIDFTYHEGKEIYFNEAGLYYFIIHSQKEEAKKFQKFIMFELLPSIRKSICNDLMTNIEQRDYKINYLISIVEETSKENKQLLELAKKQDIKLDTVNKELTNVKEELEDVNDELNNTSFNLDSLTEVINNTILPNRNLPPSSSELQHYLMLYFKDKKYYFIRGQLKHVKKIIKEKNLKKENIIIDLTKLPNPIDFINKIKELSKIYNKEIKQKIKLQIRNKYNDISEFEFNRKFQIKYNKKKIFEIKNNELILNKTKLEEIINIYDELLEEQLFIKNNDYSDSE